MILKRTRFDAPPSRQLDKWYETCQRALVRDGFHCRICHESENLKCHNRKGWHGEYTLDDVMVLCEDCYTLAQVCKQRRRQNATFDRIMFHATLFFTASLIVFAIFSLPSPGFFTLCLVSLCIASLVEAFSRVHPFRDRA